MEDENIRLRDKFAIEIFKLMINKNMSYSADVMKDYESHYDSEDPDDEEITETAYKFLGERMQAAYNLADLMRKVRMNLFE